MSDELTGVQRAVLWAGGTQGALARKLRVDSTTVSGWVRRGYVSSRYVPLVVRTTGIDAKDLMRREPRKKRSDAGTKRTVKGQSEAVW